MAKKEKAVAVEGEVITPSEVVEATVKAPKLTHNKKLAILGEYTPESAISWNIDKNPRSAGKGTFDRFQRYFGTPTVAAYTAAGGTKGDLLWDLRAGYLCISGVTLSDVPQVKAEPKPKSERKPRGKKAAAEVGVDEAKQAEIETETID